LAKPSTAFTTSRFRVRSSSSTAGSSAGASGARRPENSYRRRARAMTDALRGRRAGERGQFLGAQ
jgi:hypothetical protein